jgi:antitoxin MazE
MRIAIRKIGNSKGMIFPTPLLVQAGLTDEAEVTIEDGAIVIRSPAKPVRVGWAEASKDIAAAGDDKLVLDEFSNADDKDLQW